MSANYEPGSAITYVCPVHGRVVGTVIRQQMTCCGDPMLVVEDEHGKVRRVCLDRVHKKSAVRPDGHAATRDYSKYRVQPVRTVEADR